MGKILDEGNEIFVYQKYAYFNGILVFNNEI